MLVAGFASLALPVFLSFPFFPVPSAPVAVFAPLALCVFFCLARVSCDFFALSGISKKIFSAFLAEECIKSFPKVAQKNCFVPAEKKVQT